MTFKRSTWCHSRTASSRTAPLLSSSSQTPGEQPVRTGQSKSFSCHTCSPRARVTTRVPGLKFPGAWRKRTRHRGGIAIWLLAAMACVNQEPFLPLNQTATEQPLSPLSPNRPPRSPRPAFIIIVAIIIMFPPRLPASHCSPCPWYMDATALEPRHDLRLAYRCNGGSPQSIGLPTHSEWP